MPVQAIDLDFSVLLVDAIRAAVGSYPQLSGLRVMTATNSGTDNKNDVVCVVGHTNPQAEMSAYGPTSRWSVLYSVRVATQKGEDEVREQGVIMAHLLNTVGLGFDVPGGSLSGIEWQQGFETVRITELDGRASYEMYAIIEMRARLAAWEG